MRKAEILIGMLVAYCVMNFCCFSIDANAAKCKDVSDSQNTSLSYACSRSQAEGAIWISDSVDPKNINATVSNNASTGTITAYLHGVVIDNDGKEDKTAATCVKVFTASSRLPADKPLASGGSLTCAGASAYNNTTTYNHLLAQSVVETTDGKSTVVKITGLEFNSDYGSWMPRTIVRRGDRDSNGNLTYTNADEISASVKEVTLDVGKATAGRTCQISGNRCVYDVPVYIFRCYHGNEALAGYCYSSTSHVNISVPTKSNFIGSSKALTDKDAYWNDCMAASDCDGVQFEPASLLWKPEAGSNVKDYTVGKTLIIPDCDSTNGCEVTFRHYLKRTQGDDEAHYRITRSGAYSSSTGELVTSGMKINDAMKVRRSDWDTTTMYPGQKVCEKLEFNTDGSSLTSDLSKRITTTVCAAAIGEKGSNIGMEIKNEYGSAIYRNWRSDYVYAKPGDEVAMKGIYGPYYQEWYNKVLTGMGNTIGERFNALNDLKWKNAFSIKMGYGTLDNASCDANVYGRRPGDPSIYTQDLMRSITMADVGRRLLGQAVTNCNNDTKNTPKKVEITYNDRGNGNGEFDANVDVDPIESNAVEVRVPYNFINIPKLGHRENAYVYAGERNTRLEYSIDTMYKQNELVGGEWYTTVVREARWQVGICTDETVDSCTWEYEGGGDLHGENASITETSFYDEGKEIITDFSTYNGGSVEVNIPDLPAGSQLYARVRVYPAESCETKKDDQGNVVECWDDPEGNHDWAYTQPLEITVAKKPSFQVWGGDVFVNSIENNDLLIAKKNTLAYYDNSNPKIKEEVERDKIFPRYFGSWGELAVDLGEDKNKNLLASGATLGFDSYGYDDRGNFTIKPKYAYTREGSTFEYYGRFGKGNNDYVENSINLLLGPVTSGEGLYKPGGNSDISNGNKLTFIGGSMVNIDNLVNMLERRVNSKEGNVIEGSDAETIGSMYEPMNVSEESESSEELKTTRLYKNKDGSITIAGDIMYSYGEAYESLESIPKVIIYANNINISCNVERIDAILIAKDAIDTCSDIADGAKNKVIASRQLYINGAVIAGNQLKLKRTYGASTGANSMIPAEIINMDPSWYLWAADIVKTGESEGGSSDSGSMIPTYMRELAPRY